MDAGKNWEPIWNSPGEDKLRGGYVEILFFYFAISR